MVDTSELRFAYGLGRRRCVRRPELLKTLWSDCSGRLQTCSSSSASTRLIPALVVQMNPFSDQVIVPVPAWFRLDSEVR